MDFFCLNKDDEHGTILIARFNGKLYGHIRGLPELMTEEVAQKFLDFYEPISQRIRESDPEYGFYHLVANMFITTLNMMGQEYNIYVCPILPGDKV